MHNLLRSFTGIAAAAALGAVLLLGTTENARAQSQGSQPAAQAGQTAQPGQPAAKKPKDQGEYDIANEVAKDLGANPPNAQKAIADLTTWTTKYPESDYKDDRLLQFMQAYGALNQSDKVLEYSGQLVSRDVTALFPDKASVLQILFRTAASASDLMGKVTATPAQVATGEKAAKQLQAFLPTYFTAANKPPAATDEQWQQAKKQLDDVAVATLNSAVLYPGTAALKQKDFKGAEAAFKTAMQANPDNAMLAYNLGSAILQQKDLAKFSEGLYEMARAASLDPAKGGIADAKMRSDVDAYLKKVYTSFHGSDEGIDELKQLAVATPLPPADFKIKTATEIANEKEEKFRAQYPELAQWLAIKGALSAPDGQQYFTSSLESAAIPALKGVIVESKPACYPTEILVAVPEPDQKTAPVAEITLKFDPAFKGKPLVGQEFKFVAVPSAFTREPFMLTLDVDEEKLPDIKVDACPAPAAKKGAPTTKGAPATKGAAPAAAPKTAAPAAAPAKKAAGKEE